MSSFQASFGSTVVPAQLSFLAIYNPAFGDTDETAYDQIFYFYSRRDPGVQDRTGNGASHFDGVAESKPQKKRKMLETLEEEQNEQLRKVGLARGMVEFANTFSNGVPVDSIETEKSRLVMQELESGWWILASIDLTRLPAAPRTSTDHDGASACVEYSSREVSPPHLLLRQLQRAHALFLLHHASDLNELHSKLGREMLSVALERYWSRFVWDWDVLLHGNPSIEVYYATKLAGGGELGIGVGEEEWGSGEREVLEDFVRRTEGLVDVMVARYGDETVGIEETKDQMVTNNREIEPWLGTGDHARASDGIVFSGVGALSRPSMTTVSQWMDAIFRYGDGAYGVRDNPTSRPRQRRSRRRQHGHPATSDATRSGHVQITEANPRVKSPRGRAPYLRRKAMENNASPPRIPAPLVDSVERSLDQAVAHVQKREGSQDRKSDETDDGTQRQKSEDEASYFDTEKMMTFLKLGYGSAWTLKPKGFGRQTHESPVTTPSAEAGTLQPYEPDPPPLQEIDPTPDVSEIEEDEKPFVQSLEQSIGKFLIGLLGDLENTELDGDDGGESRPSSESTATNKPKSQRIVMRTVNLQLSKYHQANRAPLPTTSEASSGSETSKLRVVLYTHQPFIFVFLFDLQTPSLTMPGFYRSIHHQLGPLQKPLLRSTDPARIPERIAIQIDSKHNDSEPSALDMYDLVYDPVKMTVRTTIPNIPVPGTLAAEGILSARSPSSMTTVGESRTVSGAWYTLGIPVGAVPGFSPSSSTHPSLSGNADGKVVKSDWTRIEALNVHTRTLNLYISTHATLTTSEIERTVKTSRGWWIVWLRVPGEPSGPLERASSAPASGLTTPVPTLKKQDTDETMIAEMGGGVREAFLVRKSVDIGSSEGRGPRTGTSGKWLMPDRREVSGASTNAGPTTAKGVVEGVGVDARKWVEGLSRLS